MSSVSVTWLRGTTLSCILPKRCICEGIIGFPDLQIGRLECPEPRALEVLLLDNLVIDPCAVPFVDLVRTTEPEYLLVFDAVFHDGDDGLRRCPLLRCRSRRFLLVRLESILSCRWLLLLRVLLIRLSVSLRLPKTVLPLVLQLLGDDLVLNGLDVPELLTYPRGKTFHQPHRVDDVRIDVDSFTGNLAVGVEHGLMSTWIYMRLIPIHLQDLLLLLLLHVLNGRASYATRRHRVLVGRERVP